MYQRPLKRWDDLARSSFRSWWSWARCRFPAAETWYKVEWAAAHVRAFPPGQTVRGVLVPELQPTDSRAERLRQAAALRRSMRDNLSSMVGRLYRKPVILDGRIRTGFEPIQALGVDPILMRGLRHPEGPFETYVPFERDLERHRALIAKVRSAPRPNLP